MMSRSTKFEKQFLKKHNILQLKYRQSSREISQGNQHFKFLFRSEHGGILA